MSFNLSEFKRFEKQIILKKIGISGQKKIKKSKIKNSFTLGLILASLNLLAIPYYCSVGAALKSYGYLDFSQISILIFVVGSSLGTFALLSIYNNSAKIIQKKIGLLARNLNIFCFNTFLCNFLKIYIIISIYDPKYMAFRHSH